MSPWVLGYFENRKADVINRLLRKACGFDVRHFQFSAKTFSFDRDADENEGQQRTSYW
jgi:hypothetical protein